jgi:hypothetical protein
LVQNSGPKYAMASWLTWWRSLNKVVCSRQSVSEAVDLNNAFAWKCLSDTVSRNPIAKCSKAGFSAQSLTIPSALPILKSIGIQHWAASRTLASLTLPGLLFRTWSTTRKHLAIKCTSMHAFSHGIIDFASEVMLF